jgi:hypothetical protein
MLSNSGSTAQFMIVTPEYAASLLDCNVKNRNLRLRTVDDYARVMAAGNWRDNGETIKIARDGTLIDGQHRLHACVKAGVSFKCLVVSNLDPVVQKTVDGGMKRTAADVLSMEGIKNASITAAAVRWVVLYRSGNFDIDTVRMTSEEIFEFVEREPRLLRSASKGRECREVLAPGIAAGLHYILSDVEDEEADKFISDLADGANLPGGDPVLALRERLMKNRLNKSKISKEEIFAICVRAWNRRRQGGSATVLLRGTIVRDPKSKKGFPKIL